MADCAGPGGLLPEQVWDGPPIPQRGLMPGKPSGSALPLVWAHAEFLKLLVARETGRPVELLRVVEERYAKPPPAPRWRWRDETPIHALPRDRGLVVEGAEPLTLQMGFDGWLDIRDVHATRDVFGLWCVDVPADEMAGHATLQFTRRFASGWEGVDHQVGLDASAPG